MENGCRSFIIEAAFPWIAVLSKKKETACWRKNIDDSGLIALTMPFMPKSQE
jgi:hypothetical protein